MYNQLVELINKYEDAVSKLKVLNERDTAEIFTLIANRLTHETRYNNLRIERSRREGTILAYENAIRDIKALKLEIEP